MERWVAWSVAAALVGAGGACPKPGGGSGDAVDPTVPAITAASARGAGRTGQDLRVSVQGQDSDGNAKYLHVGFLDATGTPLAAIDVNQDGMMDSAGRVIPAEDLQGQASFTASYVFSHGLVGTSPVKQVVMSVEDAAGQRGLLFQRQQRCLADLIEVIADRRTLFRRQLFPR